MGWGHRAPAPDSVLRWMQHRWEGVFSGTCAHLGLEPEIAVRPAQRGIQQLLTSGVGGGGGGSWTGTDESPSDWWEVSSVVGLAILEPGLEPAWGAGSRAVGGFSAAVSWSRLC